MIEAKQKGGESLLAAKYKREQNKTAALFGVRPSYLSAVRKYRPHEIAGRLSLRKPRSDTLSRETISSIEDAYRSQQISREMPTKKMVKKDLLPRRIMEVSVARTHNIWKEENPEMTVSLNVFRRHRPDDVL